MSSLRIGFIGASATSLRAWGNSAHLPFLIKSPHYNITALCNSSVESARAAIAYHKLPESTAAYASAAELAKDPNVDLVVISVNVVKHYELALPVLKAGKDVYVEWPLASTLEQAEDLARVARENNVRTVVGLQGRASTAVKEVRRLVQEGKIGKIISTNMEGAVEIYGETISDYLKYLLDSKSGGSFVDIPFGHLLDVVIFALGSEFSKVHADLYNHRPTVNIVDSSDRSRIIEANAPKDTHDQIIFTGTLESGPAVAINLRSQPPIKGKGLNWVISGDKGDIELLSESSFPHIHPDGVKVFLHTGEQREVKEEILVAAETVDELKVVDGHTRAVGGVYEAFRKGETDGYVTFEEAVVRHRLVKGLFKGQTTYKTTY